MKNTSRGMNIFGIVSMVLTTATAVVNAVWLYNLIYEYINFTGASFESLGFALISVLALITMLCSVPVIICASVYLFMNIKKSSERWIFISTLVTLSLTVTICIASAILIMIF